MWGRGSECSLVVTEIIMQQSPISGSIINFFAAARYVLTICFLPLQAITVALEVVLPHFEVFVDGKEQLLLAGSPVPCLATVL